LSKSGGDLSAPLRFGRDDTNSICHLERSRGISCQTTPEISPLHSAPVEMTRIVVVTSNVVERSLCQTTPEISPLHRAHKCLCARFRSKWQNYRPERSKKFFVKKRL